MVSPSKKKKVERKGRENCVGTPNRVTDVSGAKKSKQSRTKPFQSKKFYLDLRNHATLTKLEKQLKDLGASIEQFLDQDVNYVITDRNEFVNGAQIPSPANLISLTPSPLPSPSPSPINSPGDGVGAKRTRSRAEAMLECVRVQPSRVLTVDPLDNAKAWKIPIYPLQSFLRWLDKVVSKLVTGGLRPSGIKVLRGHFIKVESAGRRPEFRELRSWPVVRYEARCPFDSPSKKRTRVGGAADRPAAATRGGGGDGPGRKAGGDVRHVRGGSGDDANKSSTRRDRMTRKQGVTESTDLHNGGGYCEMCCLDYSDLSQHLSSIGHVKLAKDPVQFAALDKLIRESRLDTFLYANGDMCPTLASANRRVLRSNKSPPILENNFGNGTLAVTGTLQLQQISGSNQNCNQNGGGMGNRNSGSSSSNLEKEREREKERLALLSTPVAARSSSPVVTNGHVTRSTTAGHRLPRLPQIDETSSSSSSAKKPQTEVQCNGIINHCHLTRLSVKIDHSSFMPHNKESNSNSPTVSHSGNGNDIAADLSSSAAAANNRKGERSRTSSSSGSVTTRGAGAEQMSPLLDETAASHHLRSKKQLWLPANLLGTTAEDEGNPVRTKSSESSSARERVSPKSKRRKLRKKRLSVEEKLIEDNKSYYKVEVLNSKLRSTGYYLTQRELELNRLRPAGDTTATENSTDQTKTTAEDKEPVVVRFKKVRKSELSILSDEAESFMFGEPARNKDTSDESSSEDEQNSNSNSNDNASSSNGSSGKKDVKKDDMDENSLGSSNCSSSNLSAKRKRRTHAEVFIHDNLDYYKFDLPGSRLRFQGSYFPPIEEMKVEVNDECSSSALLLKTATAEIPPIDEKKVKIDLESIKEEEEKDEDEDDLDDDDKFEEILADEMVFSFETEPLNEPWYQTFVRQDEGNEMHVPMYTTYPRVRLPYEYPNYQKIYLLAAKKAMFPFRRKRRSRKRLDDKPRKSPRCHASTLAILSSLKFRRKRDSPTDKLKREAAAATAAPSVPPPPINVVDDEFRSSIPHEMSTVRLPEVKPEIKPKLERNLHNISNNIDAFFHKIYSENAESDKYTNVIKHLGRALEIHLDDTTTPGDSTTSSHKNDRKLKSPKGSPKSHDFDTDTCLDVDPCIYAEMHDLVPATLTPGPEVDISILLNNYRQCNSMERADYEHLHPRAIDALRVIGNDGSCNSSDCGGSSTCELLGFTEDGRTMSKRRKRKKRNMTGWPKDKPRRFLKHKDDACSVTSRVGSSAKDTAVDEEEVNSELPSTSHHSRTGGNEAVNKNSENPVVPSVKLNIPKIKVTRSLSRTGSLDSSTVSEYSMCVVTDNSARQLRGQSSSSSAVTQSTNDNSVRVTMNASKRRASSPEKRPGRGRKKRNCVTRWATSWSSRRGR